MTAMMMLVRSIVVMRATFGFIGQLAVQIGVGQFLNSGPGLAGADGDALLGKERQRPPPDATGDHHIRSLFVQPAREQTRRVRRGRDGSDVENLALYGVSLHERKLGAAAKMFMQAAFGCWNGNGHGQ